VTASRPRVAPHPARLPPVDWRAVGRIGVVIVACTILASPDGTPSASASRSRSLAARTAAGIFAKIIRHDARQQYRRSNAAVTVTARCCGLRVLRVHYRAKPIGPIKQDSYVLRLETKRGAVQGVGIFESATEIELKSGTPIREDTWHYSFAIHHESEHGHGGWEHTVVYETSPRRIGTFGRTPGVPVVELGGIFRACQGPGPVPMPLYERLLRMLASAKRHAAPAAPVTLGC